MKKKLVTLLLVLTCTASLAGCAAKEEAIEETTVVATEETTEIVEETTTEAPVETETVEESEEVAETEEMVTATVNTPSELSDDLYSFQVSVDDVVYQFPMWASDMEALGWTFKDDAEDTLSSNQLTSGTWKKGDASVYTRMANLSMNTVTMKECIVGSIKIDAWTMSKTDWEVVLPKGIQYGVSSREDVIAAYGDPTSEYEGDYSYRLTYELDYHQSVQITVDKETGVVNVIEVENIIELEGADNSVSSEVPAVVTNYKAPTAVGDDLYAFNIELEGNLYTLPCPVSEFLANGFTINEDNSDSEFASGNGGWLELRYNNQSYRCIVSNYADYATTAENCFVTTMESSINGPEFDLTIPCGITIGTSEEELLEILKDFNYEVEESSTGMFTYYTVSAPEASLWETYEIATKDGAVAIIEVTNTIDLE